jgi:hypothetical protein
VHRLSALLLALSLATPAAASPAPGRDRLDYVSPLPDARFVLPQSNLIVRAGGPVDPASLSPDLFAVSGSRSGPHDGTVALSDDGRTILFTPAVPFAWGEEVTWRLKGGARLADGRPLLPYSARFTTSGAGRSDPALLATAVTLSSEGAEPFPSGPAPMLPSAPGSLGAAADTLPEDFPTLTRTVTGTPSPGSLFLCSINLADVSYRSTLIIADDDGHPLFYRKLPGRGLDFKRQPDGRLTYFDTASGCYYAMDAHYSIVDSFRCGNGYTTDLHDLQVLPDGHALLISYDPQKVDMSAVVPGGDPSATVTGAVIQELDRARNVVFQWRSWDHFQITDATHADFTAPILDYVHANAVELDRDGNLLLSCRHMDEITKINRETGELIWRLGGKNNQFTFVNDPIQFSHQHDIRRLPNGDITLFDNGFFHTPTFSRAVEYRLDEDAHVATLTWQYAPQPPVIAYATGSVQRLPSGNTLIGWGSAWSPTLTEVTPTGEKVTELVFPGGVTTYRAFRFEWPPVRAANLRFSPPTLNARSGAPWLIASITPEDFDAEDIDLSSVRLQGSLTIDPASAALEPSGSAAGRALRVRFDRTAVATMLEPGSNRVEITGSLATGERFRGEGELRLLGAGGPRDGGLALESPSGALPVLLALPEPAGRRVTLRVFDIRGRLVRRWDAGTDPSGRVSWDGRDGRGVLVASGIYLLRAASGSVGSTLKIVVAR